MAAMMAPNKHGLYCVLLFCLLSSLWHGVALTQHGLQAFLAQEFFQANDKHGIQSQKNP
jgi:hypothetical protein